MIHKKCLEECLAKLKGVTTPEEAVLFFRGNPQDVFRAKWLCLHFPDYPPDWESRKITILEKANHTCEECGGAGMELHVHHVQPIGQGGSNSLDNLECLCKKCHEKIHGIITPGDNEETIWQARKRAIAKAILSNEEVEFDYKNQKGEKTHRKLTPQDFVTRHGWLHVRGFCHLRKAERTFNIQRMRNLTVKSDGGQVNILYQMAQ